MLGIDRVVKKALSNRAEVVVNAPVDKVFGEVASFRFLLGSVEKTSVGPVGVGTTVAHSYSGYQGAEQTDTYRVTEFVPNRRLAYERPLLATSQRLSFDVEQADSGTRVVHRDERLKLGCVIVFFLPFIGWALPLLWAGRQWDTRSLVRRLKNRVESGVYVPLGERQADRQESWDNMMKKWREKHRDESQEHLDD